MQNFKIKLILLFFTLTVVSLSVLYSGKELFLYKPLLEDVQIGSYTDQLDGGYSIIHSVGKTDSLLKFSYTLNPARDYPFTALVFNLAKQESQGLRTPTIDLSSFEYLHIKIRSSHSKGVTTQFKNFIPEDMRSNSKEKFRLGQLDVILNKNWNEISIPLSDFVTPDWWRNMYGLPSQDRTMYFEKASRLEIVASKKIFIKPNQLDTLFIREIKLTGKNNTLVAISVSFCFMLWLSYFILYFRQRFQQKVIQESALSQYIPRPVILDEDKEWSLISKYIQSNYSDSELNSAKINKATGVSIKNINKSTKSKMEMTLKTYLNEIRLREASRLLVESDLQISQIAYDVGFSTVAHFNRVFKNSKGISPREYRKSIEP